MYQVQSYNSMRKKYSIIRLVIYIISIIFIYSIPLEFIEGRSFCIFYNLFGIICIGCGITRGLFNIINLNFSEAYSYNPLSFLWFLIFLLIFIQDLSKIIKLLINKEPGKYSVIEKVTISLLKIMKIRDK